MTLTSFSASQLVAELLMLERERGLEAVFSLLKGCHKRLEVDF